MATSYARIVRRGSTGAQVSQGRNTVANAARIQAPTQRKPFHGEGYLAGAHPSGVTTVDGVPQPVEVRVIWRAGTAHRSDGVIVKKTMSAPDGTWRVDGLDTSLRYDVIGRKGGFNDVIVSNVQPVEGP